MALHIDYIFNIQLDISAAIDLRIEAGIIAHDTDLRQP
jgi:hypothetical protein